jgi:hypothetical protein
MNAYADAKTRDSASPQLSAYVDIEVRPKKDPIDGTDVWSVVVPETVFGPLEDRPFLRRHWNLALGMRCRMTTVPVTSGRLTKEVRGKKTVVAAFMKRFRRLLKLRESGLSESDVALVSRSLELNADAFKEYTLKTPSDDLEVPWFYEFSVRESTRGVYALQIVNFSSNHPRAAAVEVSNKEAYRRAEVAGFMWLKQPVTLERREIDELVGIHDEDESFGKPPTTTSDLALGQQLFSSYCGVFKTLVSKPHDDDPKRAIYDKLALAVSSNCYNDFTTLIQEHVVDKMELSVDSESDAIQLCVMTDRTFKSMSAPPPRSAKASKAGAAASSGGASPPDKASAKSATKAKAKAKVSPLVEWLATQDTFQRVQIHGQQSSLITLGFSSVEKKGFWRMTEDAYADFKIAVTKNDAKKIESFDADINSHFTLGAVADFNKMPNLPLVLRNVILFGDDDPDDEMTTERTSMFDKLAKNPSMSYDTAVLMLTGLSLNLGDTFEPLKKLETFASNKDCKIFKDSKCMLTSDFKSFLVFWTSKVSMKSMKATGDSKEAKKAVHLVGRIGALVRGSFTNTTSFTTTGSLFDEVESHTHPPKKEKQAGGGRSTSAGRGSGRERTPSQPRGRTWKGKGKGKDYWSGWGYGSGW